MVAYATQSDVYALALPRGALGNPGRVVSSAPAATSIVTLAEHGYAQGQAVTFSVNDGIREIAVMLKRPEGTIKADLYHARSRLKDAITANGGRRGPGNAR